MTAGNVFGARLTEEQVTASRSLNAVPSVEVAGKNASVTYLTFTKWGGFKQVRESMSRTPPHFVRHLVELTSVKYDCGVWY